MTYAAGIEKLSETLTLQEPDAAKEVKMRPKVKGNAITIRDWSTSGSAEGEQREEDVQLRHLEGIDRSTTLERQSVGKQKVRGASGPENSRETLGCKAIFEVLNFLRIIS